VFIDSESSTWNLCPQLLEDELSACAAQGQLPAAVVAVDLYGASAEYDAILSVLANYEVPLIEDAAEALGARYRGQHCGSFGQAAILSFNGNKVVTASGGGAYTTDDEQAARRVRYLAGNAREPAVHYEHNEVGFNYGLSNLLAAFGRGQLQDLDRRIERRREIREVYAEAFADIDHIAMHDLPDHHESNCWLTCIVIDDQASYEPEDIRLHLEADNIESRPVWKPMHRQPVFRDARARLNGVSDRLFRRGLCLPSGSGMSDSDLERVVSSIRSAIGA
jgi:dTDP-4-amino-4,6-dideoxygalactose transaminase